jgi:hypothetical protein
VELGSVLNTLALCGREALDSIKVKVRFGEKRREMSSQIIDRRRLITVSKINLILVKITNNNLILAPKSYTLCS